MRRHVWLAAALFLFALAAWFMSLGERGNAPAAKRTDREFPRVGPESWLRQQKRFTLPATATSSTAANQGVPERPRDPMLVALAPTAEVNLVFEASAIRDSPLGALLMRCMNGANPASRPKELESAGLDLLHDLDRLAMSDGVVLASGHFDDVRWNELFAGKSPTKRESASFYEIPGPGDQRFAVHRSGLVMWGTSEAIDAAIGRLDGGAPAEPPPIAPHETYGEIYGVVRSDKLSELLPPEFGPRLAEAANRVELHADTRDGVLIVADVKGPEPSRVEEFGRALAGALAVGRVKARADNDRQLEELMELSRVSLHGSSFRVESAFPLELIASTLGNCAAADGGTRRP